MAVPLNIGDVTLLGDSRLPNQMFWKTGVAGCDYTRELDDRDSNECLDNKWARRNLSKSGTDALPAVVPVLSTTNDTARA